jgi:hypothetical protein
VRRTSVGIVPPGCTGKPGNARKGTLTGATKLLLDTTFFKTLASKGLKAKIVKGGKLTVHGRDPDRGGHFTGRSSGYRHAP